MTAERTIRSVPDVSRREDVAEIQQEGNLLVEAVSLLVQRQRETETWVSERLWQAEQRAADTERRYAELESRLQGIESHLAQLVHDVEPGVDDGRIARLREQIQDLRRGEQPVAVDEPTRPIPTAPATTEVRAEVPSPRLSRAAVAAASPGSDVSFWELLGATPADRFGIVLIGLGAIAVLYALLSQLRFG